MLKNSEREKLQDCQLLIQSARNILTGIRAGVIPDVDSIEECFHHADQTIDRLLRG